MFNLNYRKYRKNCKLIDESYSTYNDGVEGVLGTRYVEVVSFMI